MLLRSRGLGLAATSSLPSPLSATGMRTRSKRARRSSETGKTNEKPRTSPQVKSRPELSRVVGENCVLALALCYTGWILFGKRRFDLIWEFIAVGMIGVLAVLFELGIRRILVSSRIHFRFAWDRIQFFFHPLMFALAQVRIRLGPFSGIGFVASRHSCQDTITPLLARAVLRHSLVRRYHSTVISISFASILMNT